MIEVHNISKKFGDQKKELHVLENINLCIKNEEIIALFGPNGCGKSTLLRLIAGIDKPTKGEITIQNKWPLDSKVAFVHQDFRNSLYPWKTVGSNISLALSTRTNSSSKQKSKLLHSLLGKFNLHHCVERYPYQLSGGMNQLVSIARAFSLNPDVFLLDEPFSALDYQTRVHVRDKFLKFWKGNRKPVLFVSHSLEEIFAFAHKIIILSAPPTRIIEIIELKKNGSVTSENAMKNVKKLVNLHFKGYVT